MTEPTGKNRALPPRLLLIDQSHDPRRRIALAQFAGEGGEVVAVASGRAALDHLRLAKFDALVADLAALTDLAVPGDAAIGRLARAAPGALIVVLGPDSGISAALAAMRAGAHDCASNAISGPDLVALIGRLIERHAPPAPRPAANPAPPAATPAVLPMWRQEQRIIEAAIAQYAGSVARAAAALELSPSTIYRKRQGWAEMDEKRGAA